MKLTINLKGLAKATATQKRKIYSAIARSKFKDYLLEELVQTARDIGVKPELKESTIKNRRRLSKTNPTHKDYMPGKSNLTFTGELLDSLRSYFITSQNQFRFIFPNKKHKAYKNANGKRPRGRAMPLMDQIYQWQKKSGRDIQKQIITNKQFLDKITKQLIRSIKQFIKY